MKHKFKVSDQVVFTNDFGVCWGVKTITKLERGFNDYDGPRYSVEPTDTPWFPVAEKNLKLADADDLAAQRDGQMNYLQSKHGRSTTREELDSLLDGDPFEGEP